MYAGSNEEVPDEPGIAPRRARQDGPGRDAPRAERPPRRDYARPNVASRDPFFDKPYEVPAEATATPAWEPVTPRPTRSISANIKPKRRVAALFKAETEAS